MLSFDIYLLVSLFLYILYIPEYKSNFEALISSKSNFNLYTINMFKDEY